jgi:hypothetical protein
MGFKTTTTTKNTKIIYVVMENKLITFRAFMSSQKEEYFLLFWML